MLRYSHRQARLALSGLMLAGLAVTPLSVQRAQAKYQDDSFQIAAEASERDRSSLASHLTGRVIVVAGDSAAYGFQLAEFPGFHVAFDPGLLFPGADGVLVDRLARRGIETRSVNFSCPAETLVSFVSSRCVWHEDLGVPLHNGLTYRGPQLQAVLDFLRREGDTVGAVALMLGGNDILELIATCASGVDDSIVDPAPCVDRNLDAFIDAQLRLYRSVLRGIHQAAPHAIIVVHLEADIFTPQTERLLGLFYDASRAVGEYNASVGAVAREYGAVTVDFNRPFTRNRASLCRYTGLCLVDPAGQPQPDGHPSDAGYAKIAELDLQALVRGARARP